MSSQVPEPLKGLSEELRKKLTDLARTLQELNEMISRASKEIEEKLGKPSGGK